MRDQLAPKFLTIDQALDQALAATRAPVVIADTADNAGGGAPGDSTFFLHRMLERGITDAACGYFWDPIAVRFCREAGIGATFNLRIGGKCGPKSEEHTSELQSLMRISYAVFCLKKKTKTNKQNKHIQ